MTQAPSSRRLRLVLMAIAIAATSAFILFSGDRDALGPGDLAACLVAGQGRHVVRVVDGPFETEYIGLRYKGDASNLIDRFVLTAGTWEPETLNLMRDALAAVAPQGQRGVVLDVGANVGTHSAYVAKYADRVHAIEPWPTILLRLEAFLDDNGLDNVTVHRVGYADKPGTLPFKVPPDSNLGVGSFADARGGDTLELPLVRGDDHLARAKIARIDLIKIDIEGFEKPALQGLRATMDRDRPAVVLELNVSQAQGFESEAELRATFPKDYHFFWIEAVDRPQTWSLLADYWLVCRRPTTYKLHPFDMSFEIDGRNILAMPADKVARLPGDQLVSAPDARR